MKIKVSKEAIKNGVNYKNVPLDFEIDFENIAILVGKNNVGKSNILSLIKTHNKKVPKKDAANPKFENGYFSLIVDGEPMIFEDDEITYFDTSEAIDEFKDTAKSFLTSFRKEFFDKEIEEFLKSNKFEEIVKPAFEEAKKIGTSINKLIDNVGINPGYGTEYKVDFNIKDAFYPHLRFNGRDNESEHEFAGLGRGAQREVFFKMLNLMSSRKSNEKRLFIFDEPEAFSNPVLIREMCRSIKRMNETSKNYYFIIATHSHVVCNEFIDNYESIFKIGNEGKDGANLVKVLGRIDSDQMWNKEKDILETLSRNFKTLAVNNKAHEKFDEFRQVVLEVPLDIRLKAWLSITNCDIFFADNVLLVEGPTEEMIFTLPNISTYMLSKNFELLILNGNFNVVFVLLLLDTFQINKVAMMLDRDLKSSIKYNPKAKNWFIPTFDTSLSVVIKELIDRSSDVLFTNIRSQNIETQFAVENIEMELLGDESLYLQTMFKDVQLMRFYNSPKTWNVPDIDGDEKEHEFYFDDEKIIQILKRFKFLK